MKQIFTILIAMLLSVTWVSAQKIIYDQLGTTNLGNTWFSAQGNGFQTYQAISADDFDVPSQGMVLTGVVFNYANNYFEGLNIKVYEDASGIPGEIFDSFTITEWEITTITSEKYLVKAMFPYELELPEGKYWVSIGGTGMWYYGYWYVTDSETTMGLPAKYMALTDDFIGFPLENPVWGENLSADGVHFNLSFALLTYPEPNDLTIKQISNPVSGETTANQEITAVVLNAGMDTQTTFEILYQVSTTVDGTFTEVASFSETVSGITLAAKEIYEHTFTQDVDMSAITTYSIQAKVTLANDQNPLNDSYVTQVTNYGELYVMGIDSEVTACDGIFVDNGSVLNNYTEVSSDTITFYPGVEGNRVALEFTLMDIGGDIDVFDFYDGETTDAPKLFEYERYSNIYPEYIVARNPMGAITVVVRCEYAYGYAGWMANVSCVLPDAIDFEALGLQVGNELDFNLKGMPVEVLARVTNSGSDTISRQVYLSENNIVIDTLTTQELLPGQIDTLSFSWVPSLFANEVLVSIKIEEDPQESNQNNSVEAIVAVFKQGTLLESFESETWPLAWVSVTGESKITESSYTATHGIHYLNIAANDTVVMPIMLPSEVTQLSFDAYPDYSSPLMVLASEQLNGSWDTVGTAAYLTWNMSNYSFDISSWNNTPHYFAFVNNGTSSAYVDFVRGSELYYFENDLMAGELHINSYVKTQAEVELSVSVFNLGTNQVVGDQYSIRVRTIDSVYAEISGLDMNSMENKMLTTSVHFMTPDTLALYAEIVFVGESRIDNNLTQEVSVYVVDAYTNSGEPTSTTSSFINLGKLTSISEMIYYPDEVGLYGDLKGIEFNYDMTYDEDEYGIPVTFYVATTQSTVLVSPENAYSPSWIETDSIAFVEVFSGTIDFLNGKNHSAYIPFNEPIPYNGMDNLIIIAVKDSLPGVYKYPYFHTMDSDSSRFIYGNSNTVIDPSNIVVNYGGTVNSYQIPNLRFHFNNSGAPSFESTPVVSGFENVAYSYQVEVAFDSPFDFTLHADELPSWLSLSTLTDTTYSLVGTPETPGVYSVKLMVTDNIYSASQKFNIVVYEIPEFVSIPDSVIQESVSYSQLVTVNYSGANAVQIMGYENPEWITITDNGNNTAFVSGASAPIGTYTINIKAVGEGDAQVTLNYELTVGALPNFTSTPVTIGNENSVYIYNVTATINGSESLSIIAEELPTWLSLTDNGNGTALVTGIPDVTGIYHVVLKANGMYFSTLQEYDIDIAVGVTDQNSGGFMVYPNPADDYLNVLVADKANIEIFDVTGQLVLNKKEVSATEKLNITDLNSGIYLIVVTSQHGKTSKRFVIE